MKTLITHDCDQDDMHDDVGGDDYVDSDALMMITIVPIMVTRVTIILTMVL